MSDSLPVHESAIIIKFYFQPLVRDKEVMRNFRQIAIGFSI